MTGGARDLERVELRFSAAVVAQDALGQIAVVSSTGSLKRAAGLTGVRAKGGAMRLVAGKSPSASTSCRG